VTGVQTCALPIWVVLQSPFRTASCQNCPRQQCQGEDVEMVRIEAKGKIDTSFKTIQSVAGKSVDEVKAENRSGFV